MSMSSTAIRKAYTQRRQHNETIKRMNACNYIVIMGPVFYGQSLECFSILSKQMEYNCRNSIYFTDVRRYINIEQQCPLDIVDFIF